MKLNTQLCERATLEKIELMNSELHLNINDSS